MNPCIICVAITGSVPTKADNPAVPISISEQIESTQEAFEAGASIVHCHVRDDEGKPTSDPDRFAKLLEGIRKNCVGMIVQLSTGGRSGSGKDRGAMLSLKPDMASLAVGSNNFPNRVYENDPALIEWLAEQMRDYCVIPEIEIFDTSHLFKAHDMMAAGKIPTNSHIQFVMGVKNAMPVDRDVFDFYLKLFKRDFPKSTWCAAGIGANQLVLNNWAIANGGHARTGLEDNIRLDKMTLASSNAELVARCVDVCDRHERPVANAKLAREILGLSAV